MKTSLYVIAVLLFIFSFYLLIDDRKLGAFVFTIGWVFFIGGYNSEKKDKDKAE